MLLIFCCTVKSSSHLLDQLLYGGVQPFQSLVWLKDASHKKIKFNCFFGCLSKIKSSPVISCFSKISFLFSKLDVYYVKEDLKLQAISSFIAFLPRSYEWNSYFGGVLVIVSQILLMICAPNDARKISEFFTTTSLFLYCLESMATSKWCNLQWSSTGSPYGWSLIAQFLLAPVWIQGSTLRGFFSGITEVDF
jgi:hypothetical protein